MEIKLLRSFISVATLKSFSAAARELNTVQPAISRHISDLEEELGVSLLWRNTREVKVTAAGQSLLKDSLVILEQENRAVDNVKKAASGQIGNINIGYLSSACFTFLPELIRTYSKEYPDVNIRLFEMSVQEQIEAFENEDIDIGISRTLPEKLILNIASQELYMDKLYIVVSSSHPMAGYNELDLDLLSEEEFILFDRFEAPVIYHKIFTECLKHNFIPNIISQPKTMQTVITEVASELGISIVPGCIKRLYTEGCKFISIKNHEETISTEIQYRINPVSPAVKSFITKTVDSKEIIMDLIK
ncbi:MAG: LysR family transcriptional regulator [Spirochaetaceae bacterium]